MVTTTLSYYLALMRVREVAETGIGQMKAGKLNQKSPHP